MSFAQRLWTYQAERFPLIQTVPLLALFSAAAINVSAVLAGRDLPGPGAYVAGFMLGLILFFQMRVADEFKDYEEDCRHRPERAVPRGLVSLAELGRLGVLSAGLAFAIALTRPYETALCLILVWAWFALMTKEFFARDWLKAHMVVYLASHMVIVLLIDLMLTSLEWADKGAPPGLWVFLILSFVNGCVLEIGRKTWAPESERTGVETYSRLWGPRRAAGVWLVLVALAAALLAVLGHMLMATPWIPVAAAIGAGLCAVLGARFARAPDATRQKHLDMGAGLWVALSYAACGFLPLLGGAP